MKIQINGQEKELTEDISLNNLIHQYCQDTERLIVEYNENIIKKPEWENTPIQDGDKIELVSFVGGG